jgi:hypothetical protein
MPAVAYATGRSPTVVRNILSEKKENWNDDDK